MLFGWRHNEGSICHSPRLRVQLLFFRLLADLADRKGSVARQSEFLTLSSIEGPAHEAMGHGHCLLVSLLLLHLVFVSLQLVQFDHVVVDIGEV